jgi:RNA methyltransferase, TrmH family
VTNALGYRHKKVQRLRRLLRQPSLREAEKHFVIEGTKLLSEALDTNAAIESVFVAPDTSNEAVDRAHAKGHRVHVLEQGVLERVTSTVTPQSALATVGFLEDGFAVLPQCSSAVVLADVRDPGNAGTIMRSAEAAGIEHVVFTSGSVDPYNPKTVRASAGALFHVPFARHVSMEDLRPQLSDFQVLGADAAGDLQYDDVDYTARVAIVMGNEANGLSGEWLDFVDSTVAIPIRGRSESLNVSMALTVIAFEAARQRRSLATGSP